MSVKVVVRPARGKIVIDPVTGTAVPERGIIAERTPYWARRARAGEASVIALARAAAARTSASKRKHKHNKAED